MALQLILGRSGSGKSTALYETIIRESLEHPQKKYILIVPDQFTLDTQKTVIGMHPFCGTMNIDIVSFHRLAHKVFEELSQTPGIILEDLGKTMVLSRILGKRKDEFPLFGGNRGKMGFLDELKSLLSECYQYRITKEMLQKQMEQEKEDTLLYEKLKELVLVMEEFETFMGQDYIVAEQLLSALGERVGQSDLLKDSVICLDGFTGFTPVQYEFLDRLMPVCDKMYVTITIEKKEVQFQKILDYELFSASKETLVRFREMAKKNDIPLEQPVFIGEDDQKGRFKDNPELLFLEENLFRRKQNVYSKKTKSIQVYAATDPEEEALFTARTICRLVRETGCRYRDIGVITGDLERYGQRLVRIFEDYEIPCFLDDTKGMRNHPMVECIRSLFALAKYDYSYESVCHYMKNAMTGIEKEEADALDLFLLATGIRGYSALTKEFERKPAKMSEAVFERCQKARETLISETKELMGIFRKKKATVKEYLTGLFSYLVSMGYEQKLSLEEKRFEEEKNFVLMRAYGQVYGALLELFDKIAAILGEEEMELSEFWGILDAGLDQMKLGVIPPGIDQVVIGDTQRTRLNGVKTIFFLGVNEGVVPKPAKSGGILSDMEREQLNQGELCLAPGAGQNTGLEQFYLYLVLTRPSDYLYLTFSRVDQEGKSIRPSYLIGRLKMLFPNLRMTEGEEQIRQYATPKSSLPFIREGIRRWMMGEEQNEDQDFLGLMYETKTGKEWIETALKGFFFTNEESPLSREAARELYGLRLESGVTRLETYSSCAFAHFLQYGLMLRERQRYQIRAADMGQILHKCLELFSKEAKKSPGGIRSLTDEKRNELVEICLRNAVEESGTDLFHSSARNEACIDRMERLAKRTAWAIQQQIQKGDFEPGEFEWRFQSRKDLQSIRMKLNHGGTLELTGVVDRIDYYEEDDQLYVKIIDYKSGAKSFSLEDIYNGLSLQLVVYLNAVTEKEAQDRKKKVTPGGVFYFHIQDPFVEEKEGEDADETMLKQFALSGLALAESEVICHMDREGQKTLPVSFLKNGGFSSYSNVATREQFEELGDHVKEELIRYGNEILEGNIAISPYKNDRKTACDYCIFRGVCGFDPSFSGNRYRKLPKMNKNEIWKKLDE